jgi:hypothetical protein
MVMRLWRNPASIPFKNAVLQNCCYFPFKQTQYNISPTAGKETIHSDGRKVFKERKKKEPLRYLSTTKWMSK